MLHNLEIGVQFPDSENALHNLVIVQCLKLHRNIFIECTSRFCGGTKYRIGLPVNVKASSFLSGG